MMSIREGFDLFLGRKATILSVSCASNSDEYMAEK